MIEENLIEGSAFIVSARELQAALGNTIQHGMWIVRAIKAVGLIENIDYIVVPTTTSTGGTNRKDYSLTVSAAQRINMAKAHKKNNNKSDKVYLLVANDIYKIGIASDINKRIAAIQTGNPYLVELVSILFEGIEAEAVEAYLHGAFRSKRMCGEWFALDETDIDNLPTYVVEALL